MTATTFDRECTLWHLATAMMAEARSDADTARIDRALDLVDHIEPLLSAPSVYLVRSASEPDRAYRVVGNNCNCADTPRERGARHCKHEYAVQLFNRLERAETDAEQLAITVAPEDSILDLWPTDGEHPDLAPQCSRCQAEPRTARHPDGLGAACIRAELYGEAL